MSMVLECRESSEFVPHPEGIHPAVCVDVIDLGMVETEFQGERRVVPKVRVVFETPERMEDGRPFIVGKRFTASLHPKAKLAEFLGKWRGRPVLPGETIDLGRLPGASCTLVISHESRDGRVYANIDAVSKPTRKLVPSGHYDPAAARQRIAERSLRTATAPAAREADVQRRGAPPTRVSGFETQRGFQAMAPQPSPGLRPPSPAPASEGYKSGAPVAAPAGGEFDPEVGF